MESPRPNPFPIRLPGDVVAWLDRQAELQNEPRSTIIRGILRQEMKRSQRRQATQARG